MILFMVACGESQQDKVLVSYSDDFTSSVVATDTDYQFNVYAHYSDGTTKNITNTLIWESSDASLATVANGLVEVNSTVGTVDIHYKTVETLSDGTVAREKSVTLTIEKLTLLSISLSPSSLAVYVGKSSQLQVNASYENNTTGIVTRVCNFSSSNTGIATVDTSGSVSGITEGSATITATHRDSNLTSTASVSVSATHYTNLTMVSTTTEFNLEQTLDLKVQALNQKNETIILDSNDLTWSSSAGDIVSISSLGVATAKKKGSATITAKVKPTIDSLAPSTTIVLNVNKDTYMRLFDSNGSEIEFEAPLTHSFVSGTSGALASFTLKAVGGNFLVSNMYITNFSGVSIVDGSTYFHNLGDNYLITPDANMTFTLYSSGSYKQLKYSFEINDSVQSVFIQRYEDSN